MFRPHVAIYQEALSIFGHVVGKNVGAGNRSAAMNLEQSHGRAGGKSSLAVH